MEFWNCIQEKSIKALQFYQILILSKKNDFTVLTCLIVYHLHSNFVYPLSFSKDLFSIFFHLAPTDYLYYTKKELRIYIE